MGNEPAELTFGNRLMGIPDGSIHLPCVQTNTAWEASLRFPSIGTLVDDQRQVTACQMPAGPRAAYADRDLCRRVKGHGRTQHAWEHVMHAEFRSCGDGVFLARPHLRRAVVAVSRVGLTMRSRWLESHHAQRLATRKIPLRKRARQFAVQRQSVSRKSILSGCARPYVAGMHQTAPIAPGESP